MRRARTCKDADIRNGAGSVTDIAQPFDHLVGTREQCRWNSKTERLRASEVSGEHEPDGLFGWKIGLAPVRIFATYPADRRYVSGNSARKTGTRHP
jgi:hypothetical protein